MQIYPIFIPHYGCPFQCVYCEQKLITGTDEISFDFEAINRFAKKHAHQEKEVAFFGGTFTNLPFTQQKDLIRKVKSSVDQSTGIRISTRPDCLDENQLLELQRIGLTTIELGIQSFDDGVLKASVRGYSGLQASQACKRVKDLNLDLGIQLMPGLPSSNLISDRESIQHTIELNPKYIRIYPTVVLKNTLLADWYKTKKYKPLTLEAAIDFVAEAWEMLSKTEINIIKMGLHSDIDAVDIVAGPYHPSFGELVKSEILRKKIIAQFNPQLTLVYSGKDESLFKGFNRKMINKLKNQTGCKKIDVKKDIGLTSGTFYFQDISPSETW